MDECVSTTDWNKFSFFFCDREGNKLIFHSYWCFLSVLIHGKKLCGIAQTTAAFTRLKPVWIDKSISLSSKVQLMRSLVTSIFLYACESWTLTAELQRRIQAIDMRCYRKILRISYKDNVTNKEVRAKTQKAIGPHEDLLTIVKRRKLQWYGHVFRSSGLAKTVLQGTQGTQGKRW